MRALRKSTIPTAKKKLSNKSTSRTTASKPFQNFSCGNSSRLCSVHKKEPNVPNNLCKKLNLCDVGIPILCTAGTGVFETKFSDLLCPVALSLGEEQEESSRRENAIRLFIHIHLRSGILQIFYSILFADNCGH